MGLLGYMRYQTAKELEERDMLAGRVFASATGAGIGLTLGDSLDNRLVRKIPYLRGVSPLLPYVGAGLGGKLVYDLNEKRRDRNSTKEERIMDRFWGKEPDEDVYSIPVDMD